MSDFMEKMVALANGVHRDLVALPDDRARYDLVKQIVDGAEMVFAVWTDRFAQDGVGHTLIKGQAIARQAVADNTMAVSTRGGRRPRPAISALKLHGQADSEAAARLERFRSQASLCASCIFLGCSLAAFSPPVRKWHPQLARFGFPAPLLHFTASATRAGLAPACRRRFSFSICSCVQPLGLNGSGT